MPWMVPVSFLPCWNIIINSIQFVFNLSTSLLLNTIPIKGQTDIVFPSKCINTGLTSQLFLSVWENMQFQKQSLAMDNVEGQLLGEAFSFQWGLKCFCLWNEKFLQMLGDYIPLFIFKQEKISTQILNKIGCLGGFFSRHRLQARYQNRSILVNTPAIAEKFVNWGVPTHPFLTPSLTQGSLVRVSLCLSIQFPVLFFSCTTFPLYQFNLHPQNITFTNSYVAFRHQHPGFLEVMTNDFPFILPRLSDPQARLTCESVFWLCPEVGVKKKFQFCLKEAKLGGECGDVAVYENPCCTFL